MRAVILGLAGLLVVTSANAGSLQPQNAAFVQKNQSKDLGLPSFNEGTQADAMSFSAIGQSGSVQMFDLGGKNAPAAKSGDVFQELQMNLSGAKQAAQEPTKYSK